MAVVYATLIVKGKKTLDQVPSIIRKDVEDIIEALEVCSFERSRDFDWRGRSAPDADDVDTGRSRQDQSLVVAGKGHWKGDGH